MSATENTVEWEQICEWLYAHDVSIEEFLAAYEASEVLNYCRPAGN